LYALLFTVFWVCVQKTIPAAFYAPYLATKVKASSLGIVSGRICIRFGPTMCLCVSLAVTIVGNVLLALSTKYWQNFALRGILGTSSIVFTTAVYSLCPFLFPTRLTIVIGLVETAVGIGSVTGKCIGGFLYSAGGFPLPFLCQAIILFLCLALCMRYLLAAGIQSKINASIAADDAAAPQRQRMWSVDGRERGMSDLLDGGERGAMETPGFKGIEDERKRERERDIAHGQSSSGWIHRSTTLPPEPEGDQSIKTNPSDLSTTTPLSLPALQDNEGYIADLRPQTLGHPDDPSFSPTDKSSLPAESPQAINQANQQQPSSPVPSHDGGAHLRPRKHHRRGRILSGASSVCTATPGTGRRADRQSGKRGGKRGRHGEGAYGSNVTYWDILSWRVVITLVAIFLNNTSYTFYDPVFQPRENFYLGPLPNWLFGLLLGLQSGTYTVGALLTGRQAQRSPMYALYTTAGFVLLMVGYVLLGPFPFLESAGIVTDHSVSGWIALLLALALIPVGNALAFIPTIPLLHQDVDHQGPVAKELATSLCVCFMSLGETCGPVVGGALTDILPFEWACVVMGGLYTAFLALYIVLKQPFGKLPTFRMIVSAPSGRQGELAEPLLEEGGLRAGASGVPLSPALSSRSVRTLTDLLGHKDPLRLFPYARERLGSEVGTVGRETIFSGVTALSRASFVTALSHPASAIAAELPSTGLLPFSNPDLLHAITSVNAAAASQLLMADIALEDPSESGDLADEPHDRFAGFTLDDEADGVENTLPSAEGVDAPAAPPVFEREVTPQPLPRGPSIGGVVLDPIDERRPLADEMLQSLPPLMIDEGGAGSPQRAAGREADDRCGVGDESDRERERGA